MIIVTSNCSCCKSTNVLGVYSTITGFTCKRCDPHTYGMVNQQES